MQRGAVEKTICGQNLETNEYDKFLHYSIDDEVVLIEDILLFRPPLLTFIDGKIFLDITFNNILRRARERDVPKYGESFLIKYHDKYIPVQKKYFSEHKPLEISDIVVDNNNYLNPVLCKS